MTANEDVSLDAIDLDWVAKIASDREALRDPVVATAMAPAFAMTIRALIAELRSRASIGPDSERIHELEAGIKVIATTLRAQVQKHTMGIENDAAECAHALRAAGLLPGPDDIVVSRERYESLRDDLREQWQANHFDHCSRDWPHAEGRICHWPLPAALSQPYVPEGAS